MCSSIRFCLSVYFDLSPRGMMHRSVCDACHACNTCSENCGRRSVLGEPFTVYDPPFTVHRSPSTNHPPGTPPAHTCVPTSGGCGVWNGTRMDSRAAAPVGLGAPQDRLVVVTAIAAISPARP